MYSIQLQMFFSKKLACWTLIVLMLNITSCLLLVWESRRTGSRRTNPGFLIYWTAAYAAGASFCAFLVVVGFLVAPRPGYYPVLSVAATFFWMATRLWSMCFNWFLAIKFSSSKLTIRPRHDIVHVLVILLAALLVLIVSLHSPSGIGFSYDKGGYYELHVVLRSYGYLGPGAEILSLIASLWAMATTLARVRRSNQACLPHGQPVNGRNLTCREEELAKAVSFYLAYPLLVVVFTVIPLLITANEDRRIPDDPSTWSRTLAAVTLFGAEGWAVSLYRLCQMRCLRAATDVSTSHRGLPVTVALDLCYKDSVHFALQGYLQVELNREMEGLSADLECEPEPHSQLMADLYIIEPWKFQSLRRHWSFQYPHMQQATCGFEIPSSFGGKDPVVVPLRNMEVVIEPGEAAADYLQQILGSKIVAGGQEKTGYYDFVMATQSHLLCRIFGGFKIRLHAGPCYSVIMREKLAFEGDGVMVL